MKKPKLKKPKLPKQKLPKQKLPELKLPKPKVRGGARAPKQMKNIAGKSEGTRNTRRKKDML